MKRTKFFLYSLLATALLHPLGALALTNPLGTSDIRIVIGRIIRALLGLSGSVALLMFIYGGFLWLSSAGNEGRIKKGKDTLVWAMIGLVIIFVAYILVQALIEALSTGTAAEPNTD